MFCSSTESGGSGLCQQQIAMLHEHFCRLQLFLWRALFILPALPREKYIFQSYLKVFYGGWALIPHEEKLYLILKYTLSLTLSVTNKDKPQYLLTNVPDVELPPPVWFCSLFVLQNLDIPAVSRCPFCVHVTKAGANMVPKTCSLSRRPHGGLSSSVVKELWT